MNDWSNIPIEILNMIFLYLKADYGASNTVDLSQCALTCRRWRDPAQKVYYSEIHLYRSLHLDNLLYQAYTRAEIGKWVKRLIYEPGLSECSISSLLATSLLFPNLERLDFDGDELLYAFFCKMLTEGGKFNRLTAIPYSANKKTTMYYLKCLDYLEDRITTIQLVDRKDDESVQNTYLNLRNKLDKYPRLKKIIIKTYEGNYHYKYAMRYIEAMINEELRFLQDFSVKSLNDRSYLRLFTIGGSTLFPTNAVKKIHIDICSEFSTAPTEEFMLFMMNNFPNLSHLMCVEKYDYYEVSYEIPNTISLKSYVVTLLLFFKFLSKMRNCSFPHIALCSTMALELIETLYIDIEKEDSATTSRLRSSLSLSSKYYAKEQPLRDTIAINIEKKQPKSLHIHLCFIWEDSRHFNFDIAQLDAIKQIGRFFEIVSVVTGNYANFIEILNHITTYCARLKQFTVLGSRLWQLEERLLNQQVEILIENISLTKLTLCECNMSPEQLLYVVNQLPSLEILAFKDCIASDHDQDLYSIHLPNLSLECLELDMETNLDEILLLEGFYIKLITEVDPIPRLCFLMAEYYDQTDTIVFRLAPNSSESAYINSNRDIAMYDIYLKSVEKFTIKYVDADNGYQKTTIDMHHSL